MSGESWTRIWSIFEQALALPRDARPAFVADACGDDAELRRAVDGMLAADQEPHSFLDQPVLAGPPRLPGDDDDPRSAPRRAPPGTKIGRYRVLRPLGQGGMGAVYLAVRDDDAFQRRVVVKLARPGMESAAILERLRTERRILASLDHPSIARLYDGGSTDEGLPYFVLEYVEGVPIDDYCEHNGLSVDERLELFAKVCAPVRYAHQNLVVHRDIKPSNILVTADGEPKLLDFGIAKLLNPEMASAGLEPTATWQRLLTPNYASPEQIRGKLITTASDVYSLGVLLYKLLTGRLPRQLAGRSAAEIEDILTGSEPPAPSVAASARGGEPAAGRADAETPPAVAGDRLRRRLAGDLDAILLKSLRSAPRRRYGSVEQLVADIERYRRGLPVRAREGSWRYRAGKFARRHRRPLAAAGAAALVVISFGVAMALQAARVAFERDQARRERDKKAQVLSLVLELFQYSNPFVVPGRELTVREALERSVPVLEGSLDEQPAVRAELLHTSGSILGILGASAVARDQLEEALEIRRRLYGEIHLDVAETRSVLAAAYKEMGELERAEELARRAVAIAEQLLPDGDPGLAAPLSELVSVLCYRDEFEAAEELAERAFALAARLPPGGALPIYTREHVARIKSARGDYRQAVRLNREALALIRARYGEKHPDLLPTLNNLGLNLRRMEELDAAERAYQEALDLQRESFGAEHPNPYLMNNLAGVRYARGDFEGAEGLYRQARDAAIAGGGPRNRLAYLFGLRVAGAQIRRGAAAEAEAALSDLLERWRPELGEDHWQIDEGLGLLGESLSAQGRCAEAGPMLAGSFERLLGKARERTWRDAFRRLREHLERCGRASEVDRYAAMLPERSSS